MRNPPSSFSVTNHDDQNSPTLKKVLSYQKGQSIEEIIQGKLINTKNDKNNKSTFFNSRTPEKGGK